MKEESGFWLCDWQWVATLNAEEVEQAWWWGLGGDSGKTVGPVTLRLPGEDGAGALEFGV